MMIQFNKDTCQDLQMVADKEWLETNGIGGFASSTIAGINTRRYHGLLMAATKPPLGRLLLLSKLEETLCVGDKEYPLSTNFYPNATYPEGYKNLVKFSLEPFPTFYYSVNGVDVKKMIFMVKGENTTVIAYQVRRGGERPFVPAFLKVRVMIAFRDYHCLTHENPALNPHHTILSACKICLRPYNGLPALHLFHNAQSLDGTSFWYRNMEYPKEIERGMDAHEDHFSPFAFHFDLDKETDFYVVASTKEYDTLDVFDLLAKETSRRKDKIVAHSPAGYSVHPTIESLLGVSDSFLVKRGDNKKTMIAGYHWFGDWGRDTMISLPGLTLVQGKFEEAKEILLSYAGFLDKGMIPNRFPDYGELPEYNTVDASLWFIHAVYQYQRYAKDMKTVRNVFYGVLKEIVEYYKAGTRYNIHADADGLVSAGAEGVQLTWMDAKVDGWVVTPRRGKAVEINALWYNALKIMAFLAREMGMRKEGAHYNSLAQKVRESFNNVFWFEGGRYLYDCIEGEKRDAAIRPNQIFAVSLPYSMLSLQRQRNVVDVVRERLVTPYGLRSLLPEDKDYIGIYSGNVYERDRAYHQGTVWAWLMGPYISAYARVSAGRQGTREYLEGLFVPFAAHLTEAGLGTVSEIFDGDAPHTPRGCISQAWSVAELLRAYFEHVYGLS